MIALSIQCDFSTGSCIQNIISIRNSNVYINIHFTNLPACTETCIQGRSNHFPILYGSLYSTFLAINGAAAILPLYNGRQGFSNDLGRSQRWPNLDRCDQLEFSIFKVFGGSMNSNNIIKNYNNYTKSNNNNAGNTK